MPVLPSPPIQGVAAVHLGTLAGQAMERQIHIADAGRDGRPEQVELRRPCVCKRELCEMCAS